MKKLYKSKTNKKICGVCGGIAEYLNIDPTVVRLVYLLLTFCSAAFPGILVYIIAAIIMSEEPDYEDKT